ncbi:MAG: hypothetical protein ACTSQN_16255 [Candidatus Heimdallarchaeota archaeon]
MLKLFGDSSQYNNERVILNQLVEVSWWGKKDSVVIDILSQGIYNIVINSSAFDERAKIELFNDYLEILIRFPKSKKIYEAISRGTVELIRWGTDKEIVEFVESTKNKISVYPLVDSLQLLNAKIYMNALFYLDGQNCDTVKKLYNELSCVAISNFEDNKNSENCKVLQMIYGEEINELLQEGAINAVISLARVNSKCDDENEECILGIRRIITDSEYLLRKDGSNFFKDIYRLSYALDQYELWEHFEDIQLVLELKEAKEKNRTLQLAETKFLAIQKNMRIEEYDALKIGRRGISLTYDINDLEDVQRLTNELISQPKVRYTPISLVDEIDAVIENNEEIKEHLRETGQIPTDRQTIDEIQDDTSRSDDLTIPATKEKSINEQLAFLKKVNEEGDHFLINELMYAKGIIYAVGMFGFRSEINKIEPSKLENYVNKLNDKLMMKELISPLIRAITLRSARLDAFSTNILFKLLNQKGLKLISNQYKQYNFVDNIVRLISYLGRIGDINSLRKIKQALETTNNICLHDKEIPVKIARAINESILSYTAEDNLKRLELLDLIKELAFKHPYDQDLQIKYVEGLSFTILSFNLNEFKESSIYSDRLVEFSINFRENQIIEEKISFGLLISLIYSSFVKQQNKWKTYHTELQTIINNHPTSEFLQGINNIVESYSKKITR